MPFRPLPRKQDENNRQYAYRTLRINIMNVWLEPGEALNENELSAILGVSRTPIHEAVIMLRDEKLINVIPQQSSYISLIDLDLLREGYNMRIYIEPHIIRNLAGRISIKDLSVLQDILHAQEKILAHDDEDIILAFFSLDDAFHRAMYNIDNMGNTWDAIKKMSSHFDRVRYLDAMANKTEYLEHFVEEHTLLYEQLLSGFLPDFDVENFLIRHISSYKRTFFALWEKHPHYFKDFD